MKNHFIEGHMLEQIGVDSCSIGLKYEFPIDSATFSRDQEVEIRSRLNQIGDQVDPNHRGNGFRLYLSDNGGESAKIYYFVNHLNSNRLLRDLIEREFKINLSDCKSTNHSEPNDNFMPVAALINPEVAEYLKLNRNELVPNLIFDELRTLTKSVSQLLKDELAGLDAKFVGYQIGSIELSLDIITPAGLDLVNSQEFILRLSRIIHRMRVGNFWHVNEESFTLPISESDYVASINLKRLFGSSIISGVPCLYGVMSDQTELMISCKEKPRLPLNRKVTQSLQYWLHRIEWRINRTATLSRPAEVIKRITLPTFANAKELRNRLRDLQQQMFKLLECALNVSAPLTDATLLAIAKALVEAHHPDNSHSIQGLLTEGTGRASRNHSLVNIEQFYRGFRAGILIKPEGSLGEDYMLNWEEIRNRLESEQ